MLKNRRLLVGIALVILFVFMYACTASNDDLDDTLKKVYESGTDSDWVQLSLQDKLKIANYAIKDYEDKNDVQLNISDLKLVNMVDSSLGSDLYGQNIYQKLNFFLDVERNLEGK